FQGIESGDEECQGETTTIHGRIVERVVQYATLLITITPEKFAINSGKVMAEGARETLPCPPQQLNCAGNTHSFSWTLPPTGGCAWKKVRSVKGTFSGDVFTSHSAGLLFKGGVLTTVPGCPGLRIRNTQHFELSISEDVIALPAVQGADVRIDLLVETGQDYVLDQLEIEADRTRQGISEEVCLSKHVESKMGKIQRLGGDLFGQRNGDSWIEFHCQKVVVELREDAHCYQSEAPVVHPEFPFLDLVTRTLQTTGSPRPCLDHFPLLVQGDYGWWKLLPELQLTTPPRSKKTPVQPSHHHLDRLVGLYTKAELTEFRHVREFPAYTELISSELAIGLCAGVEGCPLESAPDSPQYSLTNLEKGVVTSLTPAWMSAFSTAWYYGGISGGCLLPLFIGLWWFLGRPKA
ncbi:MAG: hypothetical protein ACPH5H_07980, partial [Candidatus Poseidoniaceae archaeon]